MKPRGIMIYGESGSTKTSQVYHMVRWLHGTKEKPGRLYGKKWRMIHSDGGGYAPFEDSGMIEKGIVEVFDFGAFPYSLAGWRWLQRGFWPRDGKFGSTQDFATKPEEWEGIAGYIIEGLASCGETLKTHISNQKEKIGTQSYSFVYDEEGEEFRGLNEGHYGVIQKELYSGHMKGFNTLPIKWLIYTSLIGMGKDKQKSIGETVYVYGPQVCGNAATPQAPQWFMDCLHLSKERWIGKDNVEKEGYVAWFIKHLDGLTQAPYLCKSRVMPELYPILLKQFPYGFVPLEFEHGIDLYFRTIDAINKKFKDSLT